MPRRLWLSLALLATGAGLLATARLAGASPPSPGIFRVGMVGASVQIDPQVSYVSTGWWLEYATAAKLYNWTDRGSRLVPEVASRFAVSNHGKTYTFFLRKGFRFSDGSPVTAKNFAYAIDRVANKDLASPGAAFITDPHGANIVGAQAVNSGIATHVSGVHVKGAYKLVIRLTRPDVAFVLKLTMPFFQATWSALPLTREVAGGYPSAGPYYFASNEVNTLTSIRRNPYYRGARPHNLGGVDVNWGLREEDGFHQVMANQLDEGPLPAAEVQNVANQFGVNRTRFWTEPVDCVGILLFNGSRGLFHDNLRMRQAVSWAVDRTQYAAQAGPYAARPWTHLLPPRFPGSIDAKRLQPYAPTSRIEKARRLAAGHFRNGKVKIVYQASRPPGQPDVVRHDLIRLGFKPKNITVESYTGGIPPANWDIGSSIGWCADAPDPYSFLTDFVSSAGGNAPLFSLGARYERKLLAAAKLSGNARLRAFGKLDLEIMNRVAPLAVMRTYNNRYFFSSRVDPRSLAYNGVYQDWSIPALALK